MTFHRPFYISGQSSQMWFIIIVGFVVVVESNVAPNMTPNCNAVQQYWHHNFNSIAYPAQHVSSDMCRSINSFTPNCCNNLMLTVMVDRSERESSSHLKSLFAKEARSFGNDSIFLKTFVTETLGMTMSKLDQQFKQDMGYIYAQHKQLFFDFFSTIQAYLFGSRDNVNEMVHSFFHQLLSRMTQILLNVKPTDDMKFAKCFAARLKTKRPFENIPETIINMTRAAFPPTRLAINAMAFAQEALNTAANLTQFSTTCTSEILRMNFCSLCNGFTSISPCDSKCSELVRVCAPQQLALADTWLKFIVSLQQSLTLLNKFNQVHRPLQMHLTDGIMNMRTVFNRYEQEITINCSDSDSLSQHEMNNRQWSSPSLHRSIRQVPDSWASRFEPSSTLVSHDISTFKSWTETVTKKYERVKNLFANIGLELCKLPSSANNRVTQPAVTCWNGTAVESIGADHSRILRRSNSSPTDPALHHIYMSLQQSTRSISSVLRSPAEPPVLNLADPSATALKTDKDGRPISSDNDALASYLISDRQKPGKPSPNIHAPNISPFGQPTPADLNYLDNQPISSVTSNFIDPRYPTPQPSHQWPAPSYGISAEASSENSGLNNPVKSDTGPFTRLTGDDEDNRPLVGNGVNLPSPAGQSSPPNLGHVSEMPVQGFSPDDEDFRQQKVQSSAYLPPGTYEFLENEPGGAQVPPIAGNWPTQPNEQPPSLYNPLPPFEGGGSWDPESPEGDENSGVWSGGADGIAQPPYVDPTHAGDGNIWNAMKPDKSKAGNADLSNLGMWEGTFGKEHQEEIPSQIWIPDNNGVIHMSIPPPLRTTSLASIEQVPIHIPLIALSAALLLQ